MCQGRPSDECVGVCAENRRYRMLIVPAVAVRRETIRAAAVFTNIRLIGDFPIAYASLSIFVVANEIENQLLPLLVIIRFYNVLVDYWKQDFRLEANAHERFCSGLENRIHRTIQNIEMELVALRQQIEILQNKQPDNLRSQCSYFGYAAVPHRFFRQSSLAKCKPVNLQRALPLIQEDLDGDRLGLCV